jgi:hypothetical protein
MSTEIVYTRLFRYKFESVDELEEEANRVQNTVDSVKDSTGENLQVHGYGTLDNYSVHLMSDNYYVLEKVITQLNLPVNPIYCEFMWRSQYVDTDYLLN